MPYVDSCPRCKTKIVHDGCDRLRCGRCGWTEAGSVSEEVRSRCVALGLDYRTLLREMGGDVESVSDALRLIEEN
jgi:hypothetical protein